MLHPLKTTRKEIAAPIRFLAIDFGIAFGIRLKEFSQEKLQYLIGINSCGYKFLRILRIYAKFVKISTRKTLLFQRFAKMNTRKIFVIKGEIVMKSLFPFFCFTISLFLFQDMCGSDEMLTFPCFFHSFCFIFFGK